MMESQIKKLDNMLAFFANTESAVNMPSLHTNFSSSPHTKMTLRKLMKDDYVESAFISTAENPNSFVISFEGLLFYQSGGYKAKAEKDANSSLLVQMEIDRRITQDQDLKKLSSRLNKWTLGLLIATGVLALIEIIKFFCEIDPHVKKFFEERL